MLITKREVREQQERIQAILDGQDAYRVDAGDGILPAHAKSDYCYGGEYLFRGVHSPSHLDVMSDPGMRNGYLSSMVRKDKEWAFRYLYDEYNALKFVLSSEDTELPGIERIVTSPNSTVGVLWDEEGNVAHVAIQDFDEQLRPIRFVRQCIEHGFLKRLFFGQLYLTEYHYEDDKLVRAVEIWVNKYSKKHSGGLQYKFSYGVNNEVTYEMESMEYHRDVFQLAEENLYTGTWNVNPALLQSVYDQYRLLFGVRAL
ncbi:MAG: hypothetical protein LBS17_02600 [Actinomycetes bacterium]|nr:hypothetical protein [Actinomycetes bacterium]